MTPGDVPPGVPPAPPDAGEPPVLDEIVRLAVEAMLDPFVVLRPVPDATGATDDFVFEYANRAALAEVGRERLEPGLRCSDVWPEDWLDGTFERFREASRRAAPHAEEFVLAEDDDAKWIEARIAPLPGGRLACAWHDRTAEQTAADAVAASRHRSEQVIGLWPDPLIVARAVRDEAGAIVDFVVEELNPAALREIAPERDARPGRTTLEIWPENRANGLHDELAALVDRAGSLERTYEFEQLEGGSSWRRG